MQESGQTDSMMKNMNENNQKEEMKMQDKIKTPDVKKSSAHEKEKSFSIVRGEPVDVSSIDKNKDGQVYQDMMDWNVISDEPGECPLCGMILKELALDEARKNLLNHGFKVK